MPSFLPWRFAYAQLRNHRKILVIDGNAGFTGGMNIRDGHDARTRPRFPIADCHFRIDGPVLADVRAVFADDWQFATGEQLNGAAWFPRPAAGRPGRGAGHRQRPGRRPRHAPTRAPRRDRQRPAVGADRHAVLRAGGAACSRPWAWRPCGASRWMSSCRSTTTCGSSTGR